MQTQILVLNSGSSSLKFQLLRMPDEASICQGIAERIGTGSTLLKFSSHEGSWQEELGDAGHREALERIARALGELPSQTRPGAGGIAAIGHLVVHGGTRFSGTMAVDTEVREQIRELSDLAPLHNPPNLEGILLSETFFPEALQVAVFDTAFHRTIPLKARKYAIPENLFSQHGIQVYGFHGTSHKYVYSLVAPLLPEGAKVVSLHLGNGCSATAIRGGQSVDHSLGFTPSNGLIMGSRSGDIDHGIIFYLVEELGYSLEAVKELLNRESGLLGLTGFSDFRDIQEGAARGDGACTLALEMVAYRIKKYIGAYAAAMNGLDAVLFTAGIGEHSSVLREAVCRDLDFLGVQLDPLKNGQPGGRVHPIHAANSRVRVFVVRTDEELEIAREAYRLWMDRRG
jgi:acetate kinase